MPFKWCRRAAKNKDQSTHEIRVSQYFLAYLLYEGRGCAEDLNKSFRWCRKAARNGDPDAQAVIGDFDFEGDVEKAPKDHKRSFKWYNRAARQACPAGYYGLGLLYGDARSEHKTDTEVSFKWHSLAAGKDNKDSQYELGKMYEWGEAGAVDMEKAREWYMRAAANNHPSASLDVRRLDRVLKRPAPAPKCPRVKRQKGTLPPAAQKRVLLVQKEEEIKTKKAEIAALRQHLEKTETELRKDEEAVEVLRADIIEADAQ